MQTNNIKCSVDELKRHLLAQRTTKERFRLALTQADAEQLLTAAYQAEVEYRHRAYVSDSCTEDNIRKVAAFLTGDSSKFGLIFLGTSGNGKTTLLKAIQQSMNFLSKQGMCDEGVVIVDAKDAAGVRDAKERHTMRSRPILAIEDMGREPTEVLDYGNVLNPIIDLLEYRYDEQLFTIITTNLNPSEIRTKYGARIADRFNEMFERVIFQNQTYRV